jgi:hypothetical protein
MTSRAERFLAHLDGVSGGVEPAFYPIDSTKPGLKDVTAIAYDDLPEPGMSLVFTYGLSLADHDLWRHGRPELCISVQSRDPLWGFAIASVAENLRGDCPFRYGEIIDFGGPVTDESPLDGFVVFAPAVMERDQMRVDVGEDRPVDIVGMYPTHRVEREFIAEHGLEAFWRREWDPYDVHRPPAV